MLDNPRSPRVRSVAKLTRRPARQESGLFLLEGPQAMSEALRYRPELLMESFATPTALERHPEMKGQVTFLAQLQPSRTDVPEYAAYMEAVGRTAEEVNQKHGTDSWRPIELFMEDNFPRSVAAYKNFDVLLVNAVRDGMNLVAKESAVINEKSGVLVLSENAGAHEELGEHALMRHQRTPEIAMQHAPHIGAIFHE